MRMLAVLVAASIPALGVATSARADEGMWQPAQMEQLQTQLDRRGLALDPVTLTDLTRYPMNAVVGFGFCTASFVSPQGLVVTNHHCGYGAIQYNSTPERDLISNGFLAADFGDELPAEPSMRIYVTEEISDVTATITAGLDADMDGRARFDAIDTRSKALVAECEQAEGMRCEVYTFHGGLQFSLIRQLEIKDVRLVYAPPDAIGKFGGDVDNFEWPRHTGDWSFMRAYVAKDGTPAPYAEDNVPYRPASWLKVAKDGVGEGDFVMVAGYPGSTNRYRLASEVASTIDWFLPTYVDYLTAYLATVERTTRGDPAAALKYASTVAGVNNGLKLFRGQRDGFARMADPVAGKRAQEAALQAWLAERGAEGAAATQALTALEAELSAARTTRDRDLWFNATVGGGLAGTATTLYRNAIEQAKPDAQRESGYQQRDAARLQARLQQLDKRYDPKVDRALMALRLQHYLALPAAQRVPELDAWLGVTAGADVAAAVKAKLDAKLAALYAGTTLGDVDARLKWLAADRAAITASDDAALQFAVQVMPAILRLEDAGKSRDGRIAALRPQHMQAMIAFNGAHDRPVYPDANNSLRITFGNVEGYAPRDGVRMTPFTTLAGIVAKTTGAEPFITPPAALEAIASGTGAQYRVAALGDVPVNFLSNVDTTGGNSGSPTLNADGELVGLLFDGNYESLASDWIFNPALTRSIHVDFRYVRWVMDEVDHAERLLREMQLPAD